jgi:dTDP-4-dehydrorhamnose reductase
MAEAGRRAVRPTYSVLANCVLKSFGITLPHWNETLNRFIKNRETCAPRRCKEVFG